MKKNIILYMAAVAGLVLVGCNKEPQALQGGSLNMSVQASVGEMTKVAYDGAKTTFTQDDALTLFAWTGNDKAVAKELVVNGVVNTLDKDGKWIPATQMLWKNAREEHYFFAVFPAKEVLSFVADPYTLNANIQDPADYTANDILVATELTGLKPTPDLTPAPVSLQFSHLMAKLNVNLKFRSQWTEPPTVSAVAVLAKKEYTVDYLTKAVTPSGKAAQVALQPLTTPAEGYALSFSGLQVPQEGVTVMTIMINNTPYVFTAAAPITLESGKVTTLGIIVGRENQELASVVVTDWGTDTNTYTEGEAEIPPVQE